MKISVICVYNNEDTLKMELLDSLTRQECDYELILIDNQRNEYSCAAKALNSAADRASGDILIFSHQDIRLKTSTELKKLANVIASVDTGDIVGTQGVIEKKNTYYSNLTAGKEYNPAIVDGYREEKIRVSCIDEGLFGMKKETWKKHNFDENICNNWHLYAVEVCLYARKTGHMIWVAPIQMHHSSFGNISLSYMENLKRLCEVYRKNFEYIWTTCYKVKTAPIYINTLVALWKLNRKIRGKL